MPARVQSRDETLSQPLINSTVTLPVRIITIALKAALPFTYDFSRTSLHCYITSGNGKELAITFNKVIVIMGSSCNLNVEYLSNWIITFI